MILSSYKKGHFPFQLGRPQKSQTFSDIYKNYGLVEPLSLPLCVRVIYIIYSTTTRAHIYTRARAAICWELGQIAKSGEVIEIINEKSAMLFNAIKVFFGCKLLKSQRKSAGPSCGLVEHGKREYVVQTT